MTTAVVGRFAKNPPELGVIDEEVSGVSLVIGMRRACEGAEVLLSIVEPKTPRSSCMGVVLSISTDNPKTTTSSEEEMRPMGSWPNAIRSTVEFTLKAGMYDEDVEAEAVLCVFSS